MPVSQNRVRVSSLLGMLAGISDPRDARGIRHPLLAVLGSAVVATLAGAANFRELGSVAADLPQRLLRVLHARWDRDRARFAAPSGATLRRVMIELDADELDRAVGAWLREHAICDAAGWAIALDGKDLRGSWNQQGRLVLFSAMTHRGEGHTPVVLAQIAVPEDTPRPPRYAPCSTRWTSPGRWSPPTPRTPASRPPATWSRTRTPTIC